MNKLYTLMLALLLVFPAASQTLFSKVEVPMKSASRMMAATNEAGDVCMLAFDSGTLHHFIFNEQGQVISSASSSYDFNEKEGLLGIVSQGRNDFTYFELTRGSRFAIQPYFFNGSSGSVLKQQQINPALDKGSKLVQAYTYKSKLYTLHFSKRTKRFQVCEFGESGQLSIKSFNTPTPKLYDRLLKGLRPVQPVYIDSNIDQGFATASRQKKIYQIENDIYITFDAFGAEFRNISKLTTEILHLNLETGQATFRTLPYVPRIRPIDMNSFVHQETLFRFLILPDYSLELSVFDLSTLSLKAEHKYAPDEPLTIKASTTIWNRQAYATSVNSSQLNLTKDVLRNLSDGVATVTVENTPAGSFRLKLGSYAYRAGNGGALPAGTGMLATFGPAALPMMILYTAAMTNGTFDTSEEMSSFNVFLNGENYTKAVAVEGKSTLEKIEEYALQLASKNIKVGNHLIYAHQGQMHFCYLDKAARTIEIVKFPR